MTMMLDLESVQMFVLAAEHRSLTRAAEITGTVQPVVSQRLKSLEARLSARLLDRTPRMVRLTAAGEAFLPKAHALLAAHDKAVQNDQPVPRRFAFGASDHALGIGFEPVLHQIRAALPMHAVVEVRMGLSHMIKAEFDAGTLDVAMIRREIDTGEGETLGTDPLGWRAADSFILPPGAPVPLASLGPSCGVHIAAVRALERAGMAWRQAFVGGNCASLLAGARAGLGVAPMGRIASGGAADRGRQLGLPALASSQIVLLARNFTQEAGAGVRALASGIRAVLRYSPTSL
jgi:DNA-binding transcriptional LysR family regulator